MRRIIRIWANRAARRSRAVLWLALLGLSAQAHAQNTGAATVAAFESWMADKGVTGGQIAVAHRGIIQAQQGFGREGPMDLASLSKAITATCLAELVEGGVLAWDSPVRAYVPALTGPLGDAPLSAFVTHSAGLRGDSTQGPMADWRGVGPPVYDSVVATIAAKDRRRGRYRYSNDNYAILGAAIAQATGEPYAEVCADRVLQGLPSATPSPRFGRYAAWGGWRMTPGDYARFLWRAFGDHDPRAAPSATLEGPVEYGLGMVWRPFRDGTNHWHFGALCFADGPNFFTFAVLFDNGWSAVTYAEGCPKDDWFLSLDNAIAGAVFR